MFSRIIVASAASLVISAGTASAVTLLASDFTDRTVSGNVASDIAWQTNGVADPGDLTVVGQNFAGNPFAANFFDTANAQDRLAVDLNIENEGSWSIEVGLTTLGDALSLDAFSLDAFSFNNSGNLQNVDREVDVTLSVVRNSDGAELFSGEAENVQAGAVPIGGPFDVSFDLSSVILAASTDYTLVVGASTDRMVRGNNAGFDNFELSGDVSAVPLPAGLPLLLTALAGLAFVRRRQS